MNAYDYGFGEFYVTSPGGGGGHFYYARMHDVHVHDLQYLKAN